MANGLTLFKSVDFARRRNPEWIDLSDGKVYGDPEGASFLRQCSETECLLGKDGRPILVDGKRVASSTLSDAAAEHYARKRVESTGRGESFDLHDTDENGRLVAMDLAPGDVHLPAAISNYAGGYRIGESMADVASPVLMVAKQSDYFFTWNQANDFNRLIPNGAAPGADLPTYNPTLSSTQYTAQQYGVKGYLTTEVLANADAPLKPFTKMVQVLVDRLRLEREIRVQTLLQTSGNWTSSLVRTLVAGQQWNGGATSDPVLDLHKAIEASYMPVTGMLWSELVLHDFVRNPAVQKYFTYKDMVDGIPSPEKISSTLKLPPISVSTMKYVTGGALTYVWGNHVVLLHSTGDLASQMDVATSRTFRWNGAEGPSPDGTITAGFQVRTFFDPAKGARGSQCVVVVHNDVEIMTSSLVGGLILNCHQ